MVQHADSRGYLIIFFLQMHFLILTLRPTLDDFRTQRLAHAVPVNSFTFAKTASSHDLLILQSRIPLYRRTVNRTGAVHWTYMPCHMPVTNQTSSRLRKAIPPLNPTSPASHQVTRPRVQAGRRAFIRARITCRSVSGQAEVRQTERPRTANGAFVRPTKAYSRRQWAQ